MYRSSANDTPRDKFLDQFDWDGGDWLYRYKMTGAAYRVTDDEKDAFVATFDRQQRWSFWIGLPVASAIFFLLVWATNHAAPGTFLEGIKPFVAGSGYVLALALFSPINRFTFRAPLRALARRTPVAPALPKAERQRMTIERQPLALIVGAATMSSLLLLYFAVERPPVGWRSLVLIVASVAVLAWAIVQGTRKYRVYRADHTASNLT